jgi:hypothetical protein
MRSPEHGGFQLREAGFNRREAFLVGGSKVIRLQGFRVSGEGGIRTREGA